MRLGGLGGAASWVDWLGAGAGWDSEASGVSGTTEWAVREGGAAREDEGAGGERATRGRLAGRAAELEA